MKERDIQADLIRVVSCIFFIAVHTRGLVTEPFPNVEYWLKPIIIVCNPLFYLLSGKFALREFSDNKEGYEIFYRKKTINVLIPYFCICLLIFFWNNGFRLFEFQDFLKAFLTNNISYQMWFMGPMIGLLLSAPFLAVLLNNLTVTGKKILIGIGIGWNLLTINVLTNIFHVGWGYSHWILITWLLYFVLGRCLDEIKEDKTVRFLAVGGGAVLHHNCITEAVSTT